MLRKARSRALYLEYWTIMQCWRTSTVPLHRDDFYSRPCFTQPASKYVDDMTPEEKKTSKSTPSVVDYGDDLGKARHTFHAKRTQKTLEKLEEQCTIKGLKINEETTQLLSLSAGRVATRSWVKTKNGSTIYSTPTCKILGFQFSNKPNVEAQIQNLIRKANSRTFVLHYYSCLLYTSPSPRDS